MSFRLREVPGCDTAMQPGGSPQIERNLRNRVEDAVELVRLSRLIHKNGAGITLISGHLVVPHRPTFLVARHSVAPKRRKKLDRPGSECDPSPN